MSSELQTRSNSNRIKLRVRELLRNTDILTIICEFLDDKEFIAFLMVCKSTYELLKKSKIIEIRALKIKLKSAEFVIEHMKLDPYYLEKEARKKKKKKPIYIPPVEYVPQKNISEQAKSLSNSILKQFIYGFKVEPRTVYKTEPYSLIHPKSLDKSDFENKYLPSNLDLKLQYTSTPMTQANQDKSYDGSSYKISNFLFNIEMKQKLYEHKIRTTMEEVPEKATTAFKTGVKYFCPVVTGRVIYDNLKTFANYLYYDTKTGF